jgi:hypothetical protein
MKKSLLLLIIILNLFSAYAQTDVPQAKISNGVIKSLLFLPDKTVGYYRGTRFDWSGIIATLEFEGHNFYGQWFEKYNPETHDAVLGPVEEFGAVGYNEAKPGGTFLKIGVGILTRPDDKPYNSFRLYPIVNGGTWKIKKYPDGIKYTNTVKDPRYGYVYEKRIMMTPGKPEIIISHTLRNNGKLPLETTVYDHNFPVIDNQPAGPGYKISFPFKPSGSGQGVGEVIDFKDNSLIYLRDQKMTDRVYCGDIQGYSNDSKDYDIRIENNIAGAGIRIRSDRPFYKLVYWSSTTTVCPEPYLKVTAKPGEEFKWELKFEYYNLTPQVKK